MGSNMRGGAIPDEWDLVWRDYDGRIPPPATTKPAGTTRRWHGRHGGLLALAFCLSLVPRPATIGVSDPARRLGTADAIASLLSLAPDEAELPPLSAAVSRLAAESAGAACWVMRLDPRRPGCSAATLR